MRSVFYRLLKVKYFALEVMIHLVFLLYCSFVWFSHFLPFIFLYIFLQSTWSQIMTWNDYVFIHTEIFSSFLGKAMKKMLLLVYFLRNEIEGMKKIKETFTIFTHVSKYRHILRMRNLIIFSPWDFGFDLSSWIWDFI